MALFLPYPDLVDASVSLLSFISLSLTLSSSNSLPHSLLLLPHNHPYCSISIQESDISQDYSLHTSPISHPINSRQSPSNLDSGNFSAAEPVRRTRTPRGPSRKPRNTEESQAGQVRQSVTSLTGTGTGTKRSGKIPSPSPSTTPNPHSLSTATITTTTFVLSLFQHQTPQL
jgi:hypothetical protein